VASTAPTTAPTLAPTPPTTSPPAAPTAPSRPIVTGASLGGLQDAFVALYGGDGTRFELNGVTYGLDVGTGADGAVHIVEMLVYKSDTTTWTITQVRPICRRLLPPDATYQRQAPNSEGDPEEIFTSARLAHTFSLSSPWYDPRGIASITYVYRNGGVFECDLKLSV
jgi:hypothetical protein